MKQHQISCSLILILVSFCVSVSSNRPAIHTRPDLHNQRAYPLLNSPGSSRSACVRNYFTALTSSMLTSLIDGPLGTTRKMQAFFSNSPEYVRIHSASNANAQEEPYRSFYHLQKCLSKSEFPMFARAFSHLFTDDFMALWCYHDMKTSGSQSPKPKPPQQQPPAPPPPPPPPSSSPPTPIENDPNKPLHFTAVLKPGEHLNFTATRPRPPQNAPPQTCWWLHMQRHPDYAKYCNYNWNSSPPVTYNPPNIAPTYAYPNNPANYWKNWNTFNQPSNNWFGFGNYRPIRRSDGVNYGYPRLIPSCISEISTTGKHFAALSTNPYSAAAQTGRSDKFLNLMQSLEDPRTNDAMFYAEMNECLLDMPDEGMAKKILMLSSDDILLMSCLYKNYGDSFTRVLGI